MPGTAPTAPAPPVPLRSHAGAVRAVRPLVPGLLEVELQGLDGLVPVAPDTFAYVMVDVTGGTIDPAFTIEDFMAQDGRGPIAGAYYTLRRRDPESGVVTLWAVVHDHPGSVGAWLRAAGPGDPVVVWGPRPGFVPPPRASSILLVADETGLAAVAAIVESLPDDVDVVARLEVADRAAAPPMPRHPGLDLRWVRRAGEPGTGDELLDEVAALDIGDVGRWAAFGGAESRQVTRIRRLLRHERGLPAERVLMTGYWRRDVD
ncbi:MAG TPA: siderophore-interacting protein [Aquihabitans sp.]|nr:siderophore-interacting protein [Aquihabitans sp.]